MPIVLGVAVVLAVALVLGLVVARRRRSRGAPPPPGIPIPTPPPSRDTLGARIRSLLGREPVDEDWRRLEESLVRADVGVKAAAAIVTRVRERFTPGVDPEALVREEIVTLLGRNDGLELPGDRLGVVMVVGVNGSGKTTTIGKLAARLKGEGKRVTIAGSDTFRAAASEQIEIWAERAGVQLVAQERGADPGSVAFDAVKSATARGANVLIVDTAGRLHTRTPLMDELRKVKRVVEKAGATVDETLLVLDASTGQNGLAQARAFTEAVEVSGVVLTKMDGTARGGIVLVVARELGVPVKLVGTGEALHDLEPFGAEAFAERLLRE
jgi:fused signal recognition particle receptor